MKRAFVWLASIFLLASSGFCPAADCPIFPVPKVCVDLGDRWTLADDSAIVLGSSASETEEYAATRLRDRLRRRFDRDVPIVRETEVGARSFLIVLGLRSSNALLDEALTKNGVALSESDPGFNGFALDFFRDGERRIVAVAGCDANGALYGQEALFDLFQRSGDRTEICCFSCRDRPSILWRGRPHSVLKHHLRPGELDCYVRARLNYSDLRDDQDVRETFLFDARKASMGVPPGRPLDVELMSQMVRESRKRGIFLYGTVSCSVPFERIDEVKKTCDDLLELGADGLWISMDDAGAGSDPTAFVREMMKYCESKGIVGRKIAFTPALNDYTEIDRPLNRELAKLPVFNEALWFFTRVPCEADYRLTQELGLKLKPGWWYNYVEISPDGKRGFLHTEQIATSIRKNGRPSYMDLQPLRYGWGAPEYDAVRDAARYTDEVHLWGLCGGFPSEYALVAFGLWAWSPESFDFERARRSIYRYVYGDSSVDDLCEFDGKFGALKNFYSLPTGWRYDPATEWPRLKDVATRADVLRRVDELDALAAKIAKNAAAESALEPERLEYCLLEPMKASLEYARKYASFDFLDYRFADLPTRIRELGLAKDEVGLAKLLDEVRPDVADNLARFQENFSELKGCEAYVERWRATAAGDPAEIVAATYAKMKADFARFSAYSAADFMPYLEENQEETFASLFDDFDAKPRGTVLKRVEPSAWNDAALSIRGAFSTGLFERDGRSFVAIGLPQRTAAAPGDYGAATTTAIVPEWKGKLFLNFYVADTRITDREHGFRLSKLSVGDRVVWEEDVANDQRGRSWRQVEIGDFVSPGDEIAIEFRVEETRHVAHHTSATFLGPIEFCEAN